MSDFQIRAATIQDAADMARLDNIAGHGLSQWHWQQQVGGEGDGGGEDDNAWLALSAAAMARDDFPPGWTNSVIAERGGKTVGAAGGYLTEDNGEKIGTLPAPLFEPLYELFQLAAGDWLLDWLAVEPAAQGQGIGGSLVDKCLVKAKASGAAQASLVVEDTNIPALKLYHSRGFQQRDQRPYIPFNETSRTQNWLLLSAPVT
ncbi:MAG: GNAT family N-acetyltransferase [Rhizobiaceae bacterium]